MEYQVRIDNPVLVGFLEVANARRENLSDGELAMYQWAATQFVEHGTPETNTRQIEAEWVADLIEHAWPRDEAGALVPDREVNQPRMARYVRVSVERRAGVDRSLPERLGALLTLRFIKAMRAQPDEDARRRLAHDLMASESPYRVGDEVLVVV